MFQRVKILADYIGGVTSVVTIIAFSGFGTLIVWKFESLCFESVAEDFLNRLMLLSYCVLSVRMDSSLQMGGNFVFLSILALIFGYLVKGIIFNAFKPL